jgi:Ca2+-binding EF-hand superfamily protein
MLMLNEPLSKSEIIEMIKEADRDGDGKVCYEGRHLVAQAGR